MFILDYKNEYITKKTKVSYTKLNFKHDYQSESTCNNIIGHINFDSQYKFHGKKHCHKETSIKMSIGLSKIKMSISKQFRQQTTQLSNKLMGRYSRAWTKM